MRIQWQWLILAVIMLLPPLPLSESQRKFLKSRRNSSTSVRSLLKTWQNWVDLIRAGVGVYLLTEFAFPLNPEIKGAGAKAFVLEGLVLGIGLLFQVIRFGRGVQFVAPIFYVCGFTLVLAGYTVGGFAIFTGWLFAVGGKTPVYQLPVMGVALGLAGSLLGFSLRLLLDCSLIFLPLVLAFMFRQQLSFVAREPSVAAS